MIIIGIIASILVAVGLLPPYYEMWKRRGRVVGINLIFIAIDLFGAFFSLMALGMFDSRTKSAATNSTQSRSANSTSWGVCCTSRS